MYMLLVVSACGAMSVVMDCRLLVVVLALILAHLFLVTFFFVTLVLRFFLSQHYCGTCFTAVPHAPVVLRAITGAHIKPTSPAPIKAVKIWFIFIFVFLSRVGCESLHPGPSQQPNNGAPICAAAASSVKELSVGSVTWSRQEEGPSSG